MRSITERVAAKVVSALVLASVVVGIQVAQAHAAPVVSVVNADGGIYWRSAADWNSAIRYPGHGVYNDDTVTLNCWVRGGTVPPYNNNPLWYSASIVSGRGIGSGLVNDHFLATGTNQPNVLVPGVPPCGGGTGGGGQSISYDRGAATRWALKHARDTPPADSACTWFVSQALWAGGLAKNSKWTSAGQNGRRRRPGSQTAWYTPDFVNYIRSTYPRSTYTQLSFRSNAVPTAQLGDVIVYSWYGGASLSDTSPLNHAAIVVNIAAGQYPEVSEWSISDLGPFGRPSPYTKRGWTWSQKSRAWLQAEHPKVKAFLLHIDTGS